MPNTTAFFTVIYPMPDHFLEKFFKSLVIQDSLYWDLIIVNDGFEAIEKFLNKFTELNVIVLKGEKNIVKNREIGINYILNKNYKYVVFGDSDDFFSNNRVSKSIEILQNQDLVVNELCAVNVKEEILQEDIFSQKLKNNTNIGFEFIRDKNIFGLSNTAVKAEFLKNIIFDNSVVALDWFIFSQVLLKSQVKATFTNKITTWYRQHPLNIAGFKQNSNSKIKKDLKVKMLHYGALAKINNDFTIPFKNFCELNERISKSNKEFANYREKINKLNPNPVFWWENIIL